MSVQLIITTKRKNKKKRDSLFLFIPALLFQLTLSAQFTMYNKKLFYIIAFVFFYVDDPKKSDLIKRVYIHTLHID